MTTSDDDSNKLEVLTTRHLELRRPTLEDAPLIFERYASAPQVTKFLAWPTHQLIEDTQNFIQEYSDVLWNKYQVGPYLIFSRETGILVGSTGLDFKGNKQDGHATTGYVLAQDAWGNGYATEVLEEIIALARRLEVKQLVAECHEKHVVSSRILAKCSFERFDVDKKKVIVFPNIGTDEPQTVLRFVHYPKPQDDEGAICSNI